MNRCFTKIYINFSIFLMVLSLILTPSVSNLFAQGPQVNNNLGTWVNTFNDALGVSTYQNTVLDPFAGTVQLGSGQNSGSVRSVVISPTAADRWDKVCLNATYSANTNLSIDLLNGVDSIPIAGYQGLDMSMADATGCFDISGVNFTTYKTLLVRINLTRGATAPVINELKVTWNPITFILFDKLAPAEVNAGQSILYRVRVSANFVDAKDLVIWDPLPTTANGGVVYEAGENYGVDDTPLLAYSEGKPVITDDGRYTATALTVKGVSIPAGSVYWVFDSLKAGTSISMRFRINTINGTLDGTKLQNRAHFNVANGADGQSTLKTTVIRSTPAPILQKDERTLSSAFCGGNNILPLVDTNYARANTTVRFCIRAANAVQDEGRERMHNTVLWDNLDGLQPIYAKNGSNAPIVSNISGNGVYTATATTISGRSIPANSIYWVIGTMGPGAIVDHSFSLQLDNDGPYNTKQFNYVYLQSDQTPVQADNVHITVVPNYNSIGGSGGSGCGKNMPDLVNFNQVFGGSIGYSNSSIGTLRNNVAFDRIPNELTFLSAAFPANNNYSGQIWYLNDLSGTYTNPTTPPPFDFANPAATPGVSWTQTPPTDNNAANQSIWIAAFVPALTSSVFDNNPALPTGFGVNINFRMNDFGCQDTTTFNTAIFRTYGYTSIGGTLTDSTYTQKPILTRTCGDGTRGIPLLPSFADPSVGNSITPDIVGNGIVTYNTGVSLNDQGTGKPINNVVMTIQLNKININGVLQYPSVTSITGTPVTSYQPDSGKLVYNIGTIYHGDNYPVTLKLRIPQGVPDGSYYGARTYITGDHVGCPAKATASNLRTGLVTASERIQVFKNDVVSLIGSGENIDYTLSYRSIGPSPSVNTWVVDRIPFESVFLRAKAPQGERVWFTDKLPPNMPANQISVFEPVDFAVIQANFSPGIVNNNGTPSNYTDDIITSPFGSKTTWIAYQVDAPGLGILPITASFKEVAFTVKNDKDGTGVGTTGSAAGTVIFNEEVIFSDNLLQAVGNEVRTTILDYPGLYLRKYSDKELLSAGQSFNWIIEYYNASDAIDDIVTITDKLPAGVTVNSISHKWNAAAVANGKPSGLINITSNSNVITTPNSDGTTTVQVNVAGSPGLLADLLTEEGGNIYLNVSVANTVQSGTVLLNNVRGSSQTGSNATVIDDQDIVSVFNPDVTLSKLVDNTTPNTGQTLKYTLVVSNQGLVDAPGVLIKDLLPAGSTYVSGSTALLGSGYTIGEPVVSGNTLTWNNLTNTQTGTVGLIPAQSSDVFLTYKVLMSGAPGDMRTNIATISTTLIEDPIYPNTDSVTVNIPFPDPSVTKTGTEIVDPGSTIAYTISYRNFNNYAAANVYILETLPDWDNNGTADVTYVSSTTPNGVTPYFNASTTVPTFDPANPTNNGWSATPTSPVNFIAYKIGTLSANAPLANIGLTVTAAKPITGVLPSPGTQFLNKVRIFTSSPDTDPNNNEATHLTITPGVDIGITKVGNTEGAFPGLRPNDAITYTIRLTNTGSQIAYGLRITDQLPTGFVPKTQNFSNFATVQAYNNLGQPISLLDPAGVNLSATVPVTQSGTVASGQNITWYLGTNGSNSANTHYQNVGLPVGAYIEFTIDGTVAGGVQDGDVVVNRTTAVYDGPVGNTTSEQFLKNNTDSSSVNIYRPELVISKEVLKSSPCGTQETITPNTASALYVNSGNFGGLNSPALNSSSSWSGTNASSTTQFVGMRWANAGRIVSVTTQGRADNPQWLTQYELQGTTDGINWTAIGTFTGNTNQTTQVTRTVANANTNWTGARIRPLTWYGWPSLRFSFVIASVNCDTITNEFVEAGDTMYYQLAFNNTGNAAADEVTIDEVIPSGTKYLNNSIQLPIGATVTFNPSSTNPTSMTVNLGTLPAPATYDGGVVNDRVLYLDSVSTEGIDTNQLVRLRRYAIEPPAVGTVGNPVAAPAAPTPTVPTAPQPTIPVAPQPTIPAAPQPTIPAAPQPTIPAAPQPTIPAAPALQGGVTFGSCNCATQTAIPQIECEALAALYNNTGGPSWTGTWTTKWASNNNPATWQGLSITGGRVTAISLNNRGLNGILPAELGNLTELTTLSLGSNGALVGPLPAAWGNLVKLRVLDLQRIKLGTPLPAEWWNMGSAVTTNNNDYRFYEAGLTGTLPASWGNMTKLDYLELSNGATTGVNNNAITGPLPPEWGNMVRLRLLSIQRQKLNAPLPAEWWNMGSAVTTNDKDYRFYEAGVTGTLPASWGNMTNLNVLYLNNGATTGTNNNSFTGLLPPEWGNMSRLRYIDLGNNKVNTPLPAEWWNMGSGNVAVNNEYHFEQAGITGTLPGSWGNMTKVRYLYFHNGAVTGATNNAITGPLPPEWGNMTGMEKFWIYNNNLNTTLPAEWWNMGSLAPAGVNNDYHFERSGITGLLPGSWGNMTKLRQLYLHNDAVTGVTNNAITGPLPPEWGNMTGVEKFWIFNNNLNTTLPAEWWKMGSLASAGVNNEYNFTASGITGALPASWGNMTKLRYLYLNNDAATGVTNNAITGPLPPEWGNMTGLQTFFIYYNNLNASLPAEWWKMGSLSPGGVNNHFSFGQSGIKGTLPASWGNMNNLRYFYLDNNAATGIFNNAITGPLPPEWGNMSGLQNFNLNYNNLNASLPAEWWKIGNSMGSSKRLYFANAGLIGSLPTSWGNLRFFQLGLNNNKLSGALPPEWGNMRFNTTDVSIDLQNNQLTCHIPESWANIGAGALDAIRLNGNKIILNGPSATSSNPVVQALLNGLWQAVSNYKIQTAMTETEVGSNACVGAYPKDGVFGTPINAGAGFLGWDKLFVTQDLPTGTGVAYSLYTGTVSATGGCTGTAISGHQNFTMESGVRDIRSISSSNTQLCMQMTLTADNTRQETPLITGWRASYISSETPKVTFGVVVDKPLALGQSRIDNTATIRTTTTESNLENNKDSATVYLRQTDLAITKKVDKAAITDVNNETMTYTLNWKVLGPQEAINAKVVDVLPANTAYQSANPTPTTVDNNYQGSGRTALTWNLGASLNAGTTGSMTVVVQETNAANGDNLLNTVTISNDRQETDYNNNTDEALTVVGSLANVYIQKDGPSVVELGGTGTYTLTFGNNGNLAAANVSITDAFPTGFTPLSGTATNGGFVSISGQNVTITFATPLAAGATGTATLQFSVANNPALVGTSLLNVAKITTTTPETNLSDNQDDHQTAIELLRLAGISGKVWHDDDRDGVVESGEYPIANVTIILTGTDIFGKSVQLTTVTDEDGTYNFSGLNPGTYNVEEVQPAGLLSTTTTGSTTGITNIGDVIETAKDPQTTRSNIGTVGTGNVNMGNEAFKAVVLNAGDRGVQYNFGEDFGSLGDTVWLDSNKNGLQDASEPPVANVTVRLYRDKDGSGSFSSALDTLLATTFTNPQGYYLFDKLLADNYFVVFDSTTFPSKYKTTLQNAGSDDTKDSDANPPTGATGVITLAPGQNDATNDLGLNPCYKPALLDTILTFCGNQTINLTTLVRDTSSLTSSYTAQSDHRYLTKTFGIVADATAVTVSAMDSFYVVKDPFGCNPDTMKIVVNINPIPTTPSIVSPAMNPCPALTVNLTNISAALIPSVSGGVFEWHVSNSSGSALVTNPIAVSLGTYYLFEKSLNNCYSTGAPLQVQIQNCCPSPSCLPVIITRSN